MIRRFIDYVKRGDFVTVCFEITMVVVLILVLYVGLTGILR